MGILLIGAFVEKQHEIISPAWSGKTTEGLASPSDCHETAKRMSYKMLYEKFINPASFLFVFWSQMFDQGRASSSTLMLMKSCIF